MSVPPGIPAAQKKAQTLFNTGVLFFALGAILGAILVVIGRTSTVLFVFFIILVLIGVGLSSYGDYQYRKTLD